MNFWNYVFGDEDAVGVTPTSESSVEDLARDDAIKIVKSTWKELMRKKDEVGLSIYQEVLLKEVEMSRLFLRTRIEAQSNSFMIMLDTVVGYLDDLGTLDEKLATLGSTHLNKYRVKKRHFKHFRTAFMRAIKQYIPWTDRREAAWMWFWGRVIDRMTADNSLIPFAKDTTPQQYMEYARAIHETFDAVITDDPQSFITIFYQELLDTQPDIANLFKNTEIKQQGAKFISMVRHCIHLLDDHRTFEYKMVELGKTHNRYGVELTQLQSFGDVFTDNLRRGAPLKWTDEHTKAWEWFWKIVVDLFSRGMLEYQEEKNEMEELKRERDANDVTRKEIRAMVANSSDNLDDYNEAANEGFVFDLRGRFTQSKLAAEEKKGGLLERNLNNNNNNHDIDDGANSPTEDDTDAEKRGQ